MLSLRFVQTSVQPLESQCSRKHLENKGPVLAFCTDNPGEKLLFRVQQRALN